MSNSVNEIKREIERDTEREKCIYTQTHTHIYMYAYTYEGIVLYSKGCLRFIVTVYNLINFIYKQNFTSV